MRYILVSAFMVITLALLVWLTMDPNRMNVQAGDCNKTSETIPKSHEAYLLQYGWDIKSICSIKNEVLYYYPEVIESLQIAGLNLEPYNKNGKEAKITTYVLKDQQTTGDKLSATIFEIDGELIGGYGGLENWDPGIFSLADRERLIQQGVIRDNNS